MHFIFKNILNTSNPICPRYYTPLFILAGNIGGLLYDVFKDVHELRALVKTKVGQFLPKKLSRKNLFGRLKLNDPIVTLSVIKMLYYLFGVRLNTFNYMSGLVPASTEVETCGEFKIVDKAAIITGILAYSTIVQERVCLKGLTCFQSEWKRELKKCNIDFNRDDCIASFVERYILNHFSPESISEHIDRRKIQSLTKEELIVLVQKMESDPILNGKQFIANHTVKNIGIFYTYLKMILQKRDYDVDLNNIDDQINPSKLEKIVLMNVNFGNDNIPFAIYCMLQLLETPFILNSQFGELQNMPFCKEDVLDIMMAKWSSNIETRVYPKSSTVCRTGVYAESLDQINIKTWISVESPCWAALLFMNENSLGCLINNLGQLVVITSNNNCEISMVTRQRAIQIASTFTGHIFKIHRNTPFKLNSVFSNELGLGNGDCTASNICEIFNSLLNIDSLSKRRRIESL